MQMLETIESNIFVGSETEYDFRKLMLILYINSDEDMYTKANALFLLYDVGFNFRLSYDEL